MWQTSSHPDLFSLGFTFDTESAFFLDFGLCKSESKAQLRLSLFLTTLNAVAGKTGNNSIILFN